LGVHDGEKHRHGCVGGMLTVGIHVVLLLTTSQVDNGGIDLILHINSDELHDIKKFMALFHE
jgi:hypothetical protein